MENKNITKNQHYIPQVYLRGFSLGDDRVCRYEVKNGKQQKSIPIKSIFAKKYLYEKQDENGLIEPNRIENLLRKFEDEFAERREKLTKLASNPANCKTNCFLTADEKLFWKKYIILQMMWHKDSLGLTSQMLQEEFGFTNQEVINNITVELCMSVYCDVTPNAFDCFLKEYENAGFCVGYDKSGSLFTNERCGCFAWTGREINGFKEWDFICLPVSRFIALFLYNRTIPENQNSNKNKLIFLKEKDVLDVKKVIADGTKDLILSATPLTESEVKLIKKENANAIL